MHTSQTRPAVRVNQLGYLPGGPMLATWVTDLRHPADVVVRGPAGTVVGGGRTRPWPERPEPTSGLAVHVLDLGVLPTGSGLRVEVGGDTSHEFEVGPVVYERLVTDALGVLTRLRSGWASDDQPAGHVGVPPNTGDSAVAGWTGPAAERLYPGWRPTGTFDVSGGWYDAGDYGKYTTSGAIALWHVLRLAELCAERDQDRSGRVLDECRWQLDWLVRMQVPEGHDYAGLAFHRVHGTTWPPLPGPAHEDATIRVLHRPSTTAGLHLAAVAAQGARVLASVDPAYTALLLAVAERAYAAACRYPDVLAPDDEGAHGGGPYGDLEPGDDFYWAATELWLATGADRYLEALRSSPWHGGLAFETSGFDYDAVAAPARLDLAAHAVAPGERSRAAETVLEAAERLLDVQAGQPWGQPYAPADGWDWGSNGRLLTNLVVLAAAHDLTGEARFRDGLRGGTDYLFGRNALGQSYVVGHGTDTTRHLRTRRFGHDLDARLPPPPAGALAGGACSRVYAGFPTDPRLAGLPPQLCYLDEPTSETTNDLCIRWNAPLAFVAAHLHLDSSG